MSGSWAAERTPSVNTKNFIEGEARGTLANRAHLPLQTAPRVGKVLRPLSPRDIVLRVEPEPAYAVLDLRTSGQLDNHWRIGLTVHNVFDKWYFENFGNLEAGNWYGAPRSYLLKLEGAF